MKKFIGTLICVSFFVLNLCNFTFADELDRDNFVEQDEVTISKEVQSKDYFTEKEMNELAEYYLKNYLGKEYLGKTQIVNPDKWIRLYDDDDRHFAYLISFSNGGTNDGVLTIGALRDGIIFYEITESPYFKRSVDSLSQYNDGLIFVPPFSYYNRTSKTETANLQILEMKIVINC